MLCFLPLSRLAGGLGKHDVCQTQKFYLFENLGVFFARAYQMSLTELTSALTKMAKKEKGARSQEKGARDSPDFIWATTSVGAILVIALGREMGDSPDFIWATTLDARRSLS